MIDKLSLSAEWINLKQTEFKKDPSLIESMIHALYLLEQLKQTGLDFIFKGGTSILLPENVATSIVEKRLKLATRKNERNEKEIQFSIQSTGCH
jgi:sulfatase maturation enzyme AslB (radical SAM superfamily)